MNERMTAIVGARITEFRRKMAEVNKTMRKTATNAVVNVVARTDKAQSRLDRIARTINSISTVGSNMMSGSLLAVSPASIPIIAAIAGGLGAVVTYFAMAGAAAVAFGAVAIPTIAKLFDENAKLTAQQKAARAEYEKVGSAWRSIVKALETPVLNAFSEAMRITNKTLQMARPLFDSAAIAVNNLLKSLNASMDSAPIKAFFDYMNKNAGPMLETLGKTIGNFTKGIMSMMVAFGPLSEDFAAGFLKMSQRFAEWAAGLSKSEKFQSFITYVRENAPKVLSLIGNLADFLVNLGVAMAPMGSKILDIVNGFLEWSNKMMEAHPWIGKMVGGLIVFTGLLKALTPLLILGNSLFSGFGGALMGIAKKALPVIMPFLKTLGVNMVRLGKTFLVQGARIAAGWLIAMGPIGWIILAVTALVALVIWKWDEIKAWTIKAWNAIVNFIKGAFEKLINLPMIKGFVDTLSAVWDTVKTTAETAWNTLKSTVLNVISTFLDSAKKNFETLKSTLSNVWENIKSAAAGAWDLLKNIILGAVLLLIDLVTGDFKGFASHLSQIWNNIKAAASQIWNGIKGAILALVNGTITSMKTSWNALKDILSSIWNGIKSVASTVWNAIKDTLYKLTVGAYNAVRDQYEKLKNTVSEKMTAAKDKIISIWNEAKSFLTNIDLKQIGKDIIQGLINGIGSMTGAVMDKVESIANSIKDKIKGALEINSPSHWTDWVGKMLGKGLVNGIASMIKPVTAIASKMAQAAMIDPVRVPSMQRLSGIGLNPALAGGAIEHTMKPTTPSRYDSKSKDSRSGMDVTNNFYSPTALTPSETARKNLEVSRRLAMEWGV